MANRVENLERVLGGIGNISKGAPDAINNVLTDFSDTEVKRLEEQGYPAARGDYNRTYRLRKGWAALNGGGNSWGVENTVPYAGWVVDKQMQAWMHEGRWWVAQDIVGAHFSEMVPEAMAEEFIGLYDA